MQSVTQEMKGRCTCCYDEARIVYKHSRNIQCWRVNCEILDVFSLDVTPETVATKSLCERCSWNCRTVVIHTRSYWVRLVTYTFTT
jgi:hypothetical protein